MNPLHQNVDSYKKELEKLSVDKFLELIVTDTTDKSYHASDHQNRVQLNSQYYMNWLVYSQSLSIADTINLDTKIPPKIAKFILSLLKKSDQATSDPSYLLHQYYRIQNIKYILVSISSINYVNSTCIVFSVKRNGVPLRTNYAYIYTQHTSTYNYDPMTFEHQYICTGPNLISSDGEYRPRFTTYKAVQSVRALYPYLWKAIDEYLIPRNSTNFYQNYYCPLSTDTPPRDYTEEVRIQIRNERISVDLFIIAWFSHTFLTYLGLEYRQLDPTYTKNMTIASDNSFMVELVNTFTLPSLKLFYADCGSLNTVNRKIAKPSCGQKIIYMPHESLENVMNIEHKQWLEIYVAKKVTDLVLNNVCPGVSVTTNWFPVYNVDKWIFNNTEIVEVMQHSTSATTTPTYDTVTSVSNTAVLIVSEYSGRTIYEIPSLIKSEDYIDSTGNIFEEYGRFSKYLFDVIYALLCINIKFGFIHGDLHLNNVTIQHAIKTHATTSSTDMGRRATLYVVDGVTYGFINSSKYPKLLLTATIIDFGRAIISRSAATANDVIGDHSVIEYNQHARILSYYETAFPDFYKCHLDALTSAMERDFDSVFQVFTAVDIYTHTTKLIQLIENKKYKLNTNDMAITLVAKIHKAAAEYLTTEMSTLIGLINKSSKLSLASYPNHSIITRCFDNYVINANSFGAIDTIFDIFIFDSELKYTICKDFDNLPPRFKYSKLMKNYNDTPIEIPHFLLNSDKERLTFSHNNTTISNLIRKGIGG